MNTKDFEKWTTCTKGRAMLALVHLKSSHLAASSSKCFPDPLCLRPTRPYESPNLFFFAFLSISSLITLSTGSNALIVTRGQQHRALKTARQIECALLKFPDSESFSLIRLSSGTKEFCGAYASGNRHIDTLSQSFRLVHLQMPA